MHVISKLLRGVSPFIGRLSHNWANSCIIRRMSCTDTASVASMAQQCFKGCDDRYNGVTINSKDEPCESEIFSTRLDASLQEWLKSQKRAVWFKVYIPHSAWIPELTKRGFKFHHARDEYVMLYRWLPSNEECNIPPYAHTNLGVGAFVYNEKTHEVLVIKEKHSPIRVLWKLPGGYVEPGENIEDAIQREVLEETGIEATFKCLVAFRHGHNYVFGCSDIYMIAYMSPDSTDIHKCPREISECRWMKLDEYMNHPEVHENNQAFARKMYEFIQHKKGFVVEHARHPLTKKPINVYSISRVVPDI